MIVKDKINNLGHRGKCKGIVSEKSSKGLTGLGAACTDPVTGFIDGTCVAQQSVDAGQRQIDWINASNAAQRQVCESNRALNAANGFPQPDNCADIYPVAQNITVYTGYGNVTQGSGGSLPSDTVPVSAQNAPIITYNPGGTVKPAGTTSTVTSVATPPGTAPTMSSQTVTSVAKSINDAITKALPASVSNVFGSETGLILAGVALVGLFLVMGKK